MNSSQHKAERINSTTVFLNVGTADISSMASKRKHKQERNEHRTWHICTHTTKQKLPNIYKLCTVKGSTYLTNCRRR